VGGRGGTATAAWLLGGLAAVALIGGCPSGALAANGAISGTVSEASTHKALAGIEVCAFATVAQGAGEEEGEQSGCAKTGAAGEYTISELSASSYAVVFGNPFAGTLNYVTQYYKDKASPGEATPVPVTAGATTTEVNADLQEGSEISGTVTSAATGAPVEGALACAATVNGSVVFEVVACALTAAGGGYTIAGLPAGSFDVVFLDGAAYDSQLYDGAKVFAEATAVSLAATEHKLGIDAALQLRTEAPPPIPGAGEPVPGAKPSLPGAVMPGGLSRTAVSLLDKRLAVDRAGRALVSIRCAAMAACRGRLALTEKRAIRRAGRTVTETVRIGQARFWLKAGRAATVKIALGPTGRGLLDAGHGQFTAHLAIEQSAPTPGVTAIAHVLLVAEQHGAPRG
jgi:hypothetical protein